jgi:formylmethanofuran dehydrogenase subunit C
MVLKPSKTRVGNGVGSQDQLSDLMESLKGGSGEKVIINPQLIKSLDRWMGEMKSHKGPGFEKIFTQAVEDISRFDINNQMIQAVIDQHLVKFKQGENRKNNIGHIVSALVNCSKENELTLDVTNLEKPNSLLYRCSGKNVLVKGDVGSYFAEHAFSGTLRLLGSAEENFGAYLMGADVICEKNVANSVAYGAEKGSIHVIGSAGSMAGLRLRGATLIIDGNAGDHLGVEGVSGRIHVGGKIGFCGNGAENLAITQGPNQSIVDPREPNKMY